MTNRLAERAAAIRNYLHDQPDRATVRRYAFVAARWEELKLAQIDGRTTPDEDARLREVSDVLRVLTEKLDLGGVTGDFLPRDPQRLLKESWEEAARLWFP